MKQRAQFRIVAAAATILMTACAASSALAIGIVADSAAEFSAVQGQNGWYSGYLEGSFTANDFLQLPTYSVSDSAWVYSLAHPPWTQVGALYMHPDGPNNGRPIRWAVRRWVSDVAGPVIIAGDLAMRNGGGNQDSDGITGKIWVDGISILSQPLYAWDQTGVHYLLNTTVSVGSKVDFILDSNGPGPYPGQTDYYDTTLFTAQVTLIPEPVTIAGLMLGLGGLAGYVRKRRTQIGFSSMTQPLGH